MSGYCDDCGNTMCICHMIAADELSRDGVGDFERAVRAAFHEACELLLSKHQDYGPKNIAESPYGPIKGVIGRLHDKMARLVHLTNKDGPPNHESLRTTFMDSANHNIIGVLVADGNWPGVAALDVRGVRVVEAKRDFPG